MPWSVVEKAFSVETYLTTRSFNETAVLFRHRIQCRKTPSKSRVYNWVKKFRSDGTVKTQCCKNFGRPRHARSDENIQVLSDSVNVSPLDSVRHRAQHIPIQVSRDL